MGFSVMLWGAKKLVPAEYWCPYGTHYKSHLSQLSIPLERMYTQKAVSSSVADTLKQHAVSFLFLYINCLVE